MIKSAIFAILLLAPGPEVTQPEEVGPVVVFDEKTLEQTAKDGGSRSTMTLEDALLHGRFLYISPTLLEQLPPR